MGLVREPIYQQLNQALVELIRSGEFPVGSRFLTERQISERFGVSRATANKALSNLVSEGVVTFRKGVGTYVRGRPMDYNLRALVSFTEEAIAAGKVPETRVLHFETTPACEAGEDVVELMRVTAETPLIYVERLRLADGLPVILERRHVVAEYCPGFSAGDAAGSIYEVFTRKYRLTVEGADQSVRGVNIHGTDARILKVRHDAAGLLITSVGNLAGGRPLWFERTLYRGDAYEFHNLLGGIQPAGVALGRFL
ncbi:MAG TPA: GntR family transcriptional regulator [Bryobacteraceae bacterium]|nr:GntR family transcriptional regulator [Bryobacteraceae bacterium]